MKTQILSLVICFGIIFTAAAQSNLQLVNENAAMAMVNVKKSAKETKEDATSHLASFPGGMQELGAYLQENLTYPMEARENAIEGKVKVVFEVTAEGKIQSATVLSGIGYGCDEEALRVVKAMPSWKPAQQAGNKITSKVVLPISFNLTGF
ncbi:MAG: energy transducer TonB [Saprospiraceae bacterium]|nr:energy transducer TonB [Saprospiraceae bacterium]